MTGAVPQRADRQTHRFIGQRSMSRTESILKALAVALLSVLVGAAGVAGLPSAASAQKPPRVKRPDDAKAPPLVRPDRLGRDKLKVKGPRPGDKLRGVPAPRRPPGDDTATRVREGSAGDDKGKVHTGKKSGVLDTKGGKKIDFDPKKFGDEEVTDVSKDVEDVISWETHFKQGAKCKKLPLNAKIRLDFNEISLSDLTKFISCITEQNFILSGAAKKGGTISIMSPKPVTVFEAYKAYLSALEANGLTVVPNGSFLEIVPNGEARQKGAPLYRGATPNEDRIVTRLLQLEHVGAEEILPVLDKFRGKASDITVYNPTNTLIVTDTGSSIIRLVRLIRELDVPIGKEKIWIRPVVNADASEIVTTLTSLFGGGGGKATGRATPARKPASRGKSKAAAATSSVVGPSGGDLANIEITKMLADDRTNSVIFIASRSVYFQLDKLIRKLDVPIPGEGAIHIHRLENADASEISSTLSSLTSGSKSTSRSKTKTKTKTKTATGATVGNLFEGEVKITAYEPTNSLVVESSLKDYLSLRKVIQQLDVRRKQVYVEAIIMEISQSADQQLGIGSQGGLTFDIDGDVVPLLFGSGGLDFLGGLQTASDGGIAMGLQGPNVDVSSGVGTDGTSSTFSIPKFGFIMKAIKTVANANVLSAPHILTLENEEAEIQVGKRQPYRNASFGGLGNLSSLAGGLGTSGASSALGGLSSLGGLTSQVQYVDVDLTLKIKPQVNASDFVRLEIEQSLDDIEGFFQGEVPITAKRKVSNVVVVRDGQPVVIGGLMRDQETKSVSKVPILGDIPLIGMLFRQTQTTVEKKNLLVIIVPHVIKDPSDLKRIYEQRRQEYRDFADVMDQRQLEFEGRLDFRKKNGLLQAMYKTVGKARTERELREQSLLESSDVDNVGPADSHDIEYDPSEGRAKEEGKRKGRR